VETVTTEPEIAGEPENLSRPGEWEEAHSRVRAYLAAWRIGDQESRQNCSSEIIQLARKRVTAVPGLTPLEAAMDQADEFLASWFVPSADPASQNHSSGLSTEARIALLLGSPGGALNFADRTQMIAASRQGALTCTQARVPGRSPEMRAMTMQTSLSRLPSIRLIGGWIGLIGLLILSFFLTH
jgi:hypothetical protein